MKTLKQKTIGRLTVLVFLLAPQLAFPFGEQTISMDGTIKTAITQDGFGIVAYSAQFSVPGGNNHVYLKLLRPNGAQAGAVIHVGEFSNFDLDYDGNGHFILFTLKTSLFNPSSNRVEVRNYEILGLNTPNPYLSQMYNSIVVDSGIQVGGNLYAVISGSFSDPGKFVVAYSIQPLNFPTIYRSRIRKCEYSIGTPHLIGFVSEDILNTETTQVASRDSGDFVAAYSYGAEPNNIKIRKYSAAAVLIGSEFDMTSTGEETFFASFDVKFHNDGWYYVLSRKKFGNLVGYHKGLFSGTGVSSRFTVYSGFDTIGLSQGLYHQQIAVTDSFLHILHSNYNNFKHCGYYKVKRSDDSTVFMDTLFTFNNGSVPSVSVAANECGLAVNAWMYWAGTNAAVPLHAVLPDYHPRVSPDTVTGCGLVTQTFTVNIDTADPTLSGFEYEWFYPAAQATPVGSIFNSPTATFNITGNCMISVKVKYCGKEVTATAYAMVTPLPFSLDAGPDLVYCGDGTGIQPQSSAPSGTYLWTANTADSISGLDSVNSALLSPVLFPAGTTTYYLQVTDANGCVGLDSMTIGVITPPSLLSAGPPDTLCLRDTLHLAGQVSSGWPFAWSSLPPEPNLDSALLVQSFVPSAPGLYNFILSVTDSAYGCTFRDTAVVFIHERPLVYSIPGNLVACQGEAVTLYSGSQNHSCVWTASPPAPGFPSTDCTLEVVPVGNTQYSVTITDSTNCTVQAGFEVSVITKPEVVIYPASFPECTKPPREVTPTGCINACAGNLMAYSPKKYAGASYTWSVTGATAYYTASDSLFVTWGSEGNGSLTLTVTDSNGCGNTVTECVVILAQPDALIATQSGIQSTLNVCLNQAFQLYDQSTGIAPAALSPWYWDFGDGNVSIDKDPLHSYSSPGSYYVKLRVKNSCHCYDTDSVLVTVNDLPGPDIICRSVVCAHATETYTTTTVSCTGVYDWSVEGGAILSSTPYGSAITVLWGNGNDGPGQVSLEINSCGDVCPGPTTVPVPIVPEQAAISGNLVACPGEPAVYNVPPVPGTVYTWDIVSGNGTIFPGQGTHEIIVDWDTGFVTGRVEVSYENTFLGCGGMAAANVSLGSRFAVTGPGKGCPGQAMLFHAPPGSYQWTARDSSGNVVKVQSGGAQFSLTPSAAGLYSVTATDLMATFCNPSFTLNTGVVTGIAPPDAQSVAGEREICPGGLYDYEYPLPSGQLLTWQAIGGQPASGAGSGFTVVWNNDSLLYLVLRLTDGQTGCASSGDTLKIRNKRNPLPPADSVQVSGNKQVCVNSEHTYTASLDADNYEWEVIPASAGSVSSGQNSHSVTVVWNNRTASGIAFLRVRLNFCGQFVTRTDTIHLTVPQEPQLTGDTLTCRGKTASFSVSAGAAHYHWEFGDGTTLSGTGLNTVQHEWQKPGNHTVLVTLTGFGACSISRTLGMPVFVGHGPSVWVTVTGVLLFPHPDSINTVLTVAQVTPPGTPFAWFSTSSGPLGAGSTFSPAAFGSYFAVVTDTNGCEGSSGIVTIRESPPGAGGIPPPQCLTGSISPPVFDFDLQDCNILEAEATHTNPLSGTVPDSLLYNWYTSSDTLIYRGKSFDKVFSKSGYYRVWLSILYPNTNPSYADSVCRQFFDTIVFVPAIAAQQANFSCASGQIETYLNDVSDLHPNAPPMSYTWALAPLATGTVYNFTGQFIGPEPIAQNTYLSTLTLSGGAFSCAVTDTVAVPGKPVADFLVPAQRCEGTPLTFVPTAGQDIVSWFWDFDDQATLYANPGIRTYNGIAPPNFPDVLLRITDKYGCVDSIRKLVVVNTNNVDPNIQFGGPPLFCKGDSVTLNAINLGIGTLPYSFLWNNGFQTQSITIKNTGMYRVRITDANGCTRLMEDYENVAAYQTPVPVIRGRLTACRGETVTLDASLSGHYAFGWSVNGDTVVPSPGTSLILTVDTPVYLITAWVTDTLHNCPSASSSVPLKVYPNPAAPGIASVPSQPLCAGQPVQLTASGSGSMFYWSTGQAVPGITVHNASPYRVLMLDSNGCGSFSDIIVHPLPDFSTLISGCYEFCEGDEKVLPGPVGSFQYYEWLENSVAIASGSGQVAPLMLSSSGLYSLYAETDNCSGESAPVSVDFGACGPCSESDVVIAENVVFCRYIGVEGVGNVPFYGFNILVENQGGTDVELEVQDFPVKTGGVSISTLPAYGSVTVQGFFPGLTADQLEALLAEGKFCVRIRVRGGNGEAPINCMLEVCFDGPDCEPMGQCETGAEPEDIWCEHAGLSGAYTYGFSGTLTAPGDGYLAGIVTGCGTATIQPGFFPAGASPFSGILHEENPSGGCCLSLAFYNTQTGGFCRYAFCFDQERLAEACAGQRPAWQGTETAKSGAYLGIVPNPADHTARISFNTGGEGKALLSITGLLGHTVWSEEMPSGSGEIALDVLPFPSGTYILQLTGPDGTIKRTRMMIAK